MKFRTEVFIEPAERKILPDGKIFSIGSCFAVEMSNLLAEGQLQVFSNPFGIIFNPYSINFALRKIHDCRYYTDEDLISFDGKFISLDHHSSFNQNYSHLALEKINTGIDYANEFLQNTDFVIITYGTSFIYEFLPKEKLVANCHKIPASFFGKRFLTHLELTTSIQETIANLKDICKENVQILFSVSPVRHTKDGFPENNLSKSRLISALHEVIQNFDFCHYLPVYEVMMDDLRDYRFYKEDMIHPNSQAVNYIFEKFGDAYFSEETMDFVEENLKILQGMRHRPSDENSAQYLQFKEKLTERIVQQRRKVKHTIFNNIAQ